MIRFTVKTVDELIEEFGENYNTNMGDYFFDETYGALHGVELKLDEEFETACGGMASISSIKFNRPSSNGMPSGAYVDDLNYGVIVNQLNTYSTKALVRVVAYYNTNDEFGDDYEVYYLTPRMLKMRIDGMNVNYVSNGVSSIKIGDIIKSRTDGILEVKGIKKLGSAIIVNESVIIDENTLIINKESNEQII